MKHWFAVAAGAGLLLASCETESRVPTAPPDAPSPPPVSLQQPGSFIHILPTGGLRPAQPNGLLLSPPSVGNPTITYHGGPIITTQKVQTIYWANRRIYAGGPAPGTYGSPTADGSLIGFFLSHLGGSPYYGINTTYYNGSNVHVQNTVTYTRYWAANSNVPGPGTLVGDQQIRDKITSGIASGVLTWDANAVYVVFSDSGVNLGGGFVPGGYCGYHGAFLWTYLGNPRMVKYAVLPHAIDIDRLGIPDDQCSRWILDYGSPNNDPAADVEVTVLAHEIEETNTDPQGNAWYDADGNDRWENADKCLQKFDGYYTLQPIGARANMNLGGKDFLVQNNFEYGTNQGCATKYAVVSMTVTPNPGSVCTNGSSTLTAVPKDEIDNDWPAGTVAWASSSPSIVAVAASRTRLGNLSGSNGEGQATITATLDGKSGTSDVNVVYCAPGASVSGPYTMNLYQSGRFTAFGSLGVTPYNYSFRRQQCTGATTCGPWPSWTSTGTTNYWDTIVYTCGVTQINVEAMVTDSRGYSGISGAWSASINNPC